MVFPRPAVTLDSIKMTELTLPAIDFNRDKIGTSGTVLQIARYGKYPIPLAQVKYDDGEIRYILAPIGLQPGDTVLSADNAPLKPGNVLPLRCIPSGILIHNIEVQPGKGGHLVRAAGSAAQVVGEKDDICIINLPSGRIIQISLDCHATIGRIGHISKNKLKPLKMQEAVAPIVQQDNGAKQEQDNAELACDTLEISTAPGKQISFTLKAKNTGGSTWTAQHEYRLGWLKGYEDFTFEKRLKLDMDRRENISPKITKTWEIVNIAVPQQKGSYVMLWQMCRDDFRWFGNKLSIVVNVKSEAEITAEQAKAGLLQALPTIESAGQFKASGDSSESSAMEKIKGKASASSWKPAQDAPAARDDIIEGDEKPQVLVQPSAGSHKTRFKVTISHCTPRKDVTLFYEAYILNRGWQITSKKLDTDKAGMATTNISWHQAGTYDVWVKDISTNLESKPSRVTVI